MEQLRIEFTKIYNQYNSKIYRFIFLKVSSQEIAEDLASEVFMRAWSSFTRVTEDKKIENIQAYIYQIARNVVADHHKEKQRFTIVSVGETAEIKEASSLKERAMVNLEMDRVQKAIAGLRDDYQDLIIWHYLEELSVPEIAIITGKTENNIRVGIHRALQALKNSLPAG